MGWLREEGREMGEEGWWERGVRGGLRSGGEEAGGCCLSWGLGRGGGVGRAGEGRWCAEGWVRGGGA